MANLARDDLARFFGQPAAQDAVDLPRSLAPWASKALARTKTLRELRPGGHRMLLDLAEALNAVIDAPGAISHERFRARISILAAGIHSVAATLHEVSIPTYEEEQQRAARAIDSAAIHILREMKGDYGALPD